MKTLKTIEIQNIAQELIDNLKEPIMITGKKSNAVLINEMAWRSIQETLYLTSIPGIRESILQGMRTLVSETTESLDW